MEDRKVSIEPKNLKERIINIVEDFKSRGELELDIKIMEDRNLQLEKEIKKETPIEKAIETKIKAERLMKLEKEWQHIKKNMFDNKTHVKIETNKLIKLEGKIDKALDLIFEDKELKKNITDLYKKNGNVDYKKLSKTISDLEKEPKKFFKDFKRSKPILQSISSQNIKNDIDHHYKLSLKYENSLKKNRQLLAQQTNVNLTLAQGFGMLPEYSEYIKSNDKFNSQLVGSYKRTVKEIQEFRKDNPKEFEKKLKELNLNETIAKRHNIMPSSGQFKSKTNSPTRSR